MTVPSVSEMRLMSPGDLLTLFKGGYPIDPSQLAGYEFHGTSLGVPHWVERFAWSQFKKVFHFDEQRGMLRGWNLAVVQQDEAWTTIQNKQGPKAYGHYLVRAPESEPQEVAGAMWLDYGCPQKTFRPMTWLRDPVVSLESGNPTRLLGFSMMQVGRRLVRTPSFFHLERGGKVQVLVEPPFP